MKLGRTQVGVWVTAYERAWRTEGTEGLTDLFTEDATEVQYGPPDRHQYRDLWIVRFAADRRCCEFEEWPFWPGQKIIAEGGSA